MKTPTTFWFNFFKRIGLTGYVQVNFQVPAHDFASAFQKVVLPGKVDVMANMTESWKKGDEVLSGKVTPTSFLVRRRKRVTNIQNSFAYAAGSITSTNEGVKVESTILPLPAIFVLFYGFMFVIYGLFAWHFLSGNNTKDFSPFFIFHGLFMMIVPYFALRKHVERLERDLRRELYYVKGRIQP